MKGKIKAAEVKVFYSDGTNDLFENCVLVNNSGWTIIESNTSCIINNRYIKKMYFKGAKEV